MKKLNIAQKFLIPKQSKDNGLKNDEWKISERGKKKLLEIIQESQELEI